MYDVQPFAEKHLEMIDIIKISFRIDTRHFNTVKNITADNGIQTGYFSVLHIGRNKTKNETLSSGYFSVLNGRNAALLPRKKYLFPHKFGGEERTVRCAQLEQVDAGGQGGDIKSG